MTPHTVTSHVEVTLPDRDWRDEGGEKRLLEDEASQAIGEFEAHMQRRYGANIGRIEVTVKESDQ